MRQCYTEEVHDFLQELEPLTRAAPWFLPGEPVSRVDVLDVVAANDDAALYPHHPFLGHHPMPPNKPPRVVLRPR